MKTRLITCCVVSVLLAAFFSGPCEAAVDASADSAKSSSMRTIEQAETIIYGEPAKGGLIDRLNAIEKMLFGRSLPGSISERNTAILNFLETGTADQPSMLFKLSVAEWIVGQPVSLSRRSALQRLEDLEEKLDSGQQYGKPAAMRVERVLASIVSEPVTFRAIRLPGNAVLGVRFLEELSPAKSKKGDSVALVLVSDLFVDRVLVAPRGSFIDASVREVKKPNVYGTPGEVRLSLKSLIPLGPERPPVKTGDASQKATKEAQKKLSKGEGAMVGAATASIAGAALLGPIGLIGGLFVRGDSIKIPEGAVMFVETAEDTIVSGYPVPEILPVPSDAIILDSVSITTTTTTETVTTRTP